MCSLVWPCPQTQALLEWSCSWHWSSRQRRQQVWSRRAVSVSPDAAVLRLCKPVGVKSVVHQHHHWSMSGFCQCRFAGAPSQSQHYKVRWSRQDLTGLSCSVIFGEPCLLFKKLLREFSGDPVVRTLCSQHWGPGFSVWSKIPQALLLSQKKKILLILIVRHFSPSVGSGLHKTKKE